MSHQPPVASHEVSGLRLATGDWRLATDYKETNG
jgi:hypothetical protein